MRFDTRSAAVRIRSSSSAEIGGSAPTTTRTASTCGRKARVASVLAVKIEPSPGVSTRHIPVSRSGSGRSTSTAAIPSRFPGLRSSLT